LNPTGDSYGALRYRTLLIQPTSDRTNLQAIALGQSNLRAIAPYQSNLQAIALYQSNQRAIPTERFAIALI